MSREARKAAQQQKQPGKKPPEKKDQPAVDKGKASRKKEFRRDEYMRVDQDPLLKTGDLQPRLINIDQFAESRAFELRHFLKILKAKTTPNNKLPFQSLPRHMRRRAMSHNYYRVPLRLRYADIIERIKEKSGDSTKVGRSRCRKHLRKSKHLLTEYSRRAKDLVKGRWLETHIWHAKRFHMASLWGYKLAHHCNDKSRRAAYRFAAHDCCVTDKSYYQWIWLSANTMESIKTVLERHSHRPVPPQALSGKKCFSTLWMAEGKVLAPVVVLFRPDAAPRAECIICVHPAAAADVRKSITIEGTDLKCDVLDDSSLCMFQLNGKRTMQVVADVLLPLATPGQKILDLVGAIEDPSILPNGAVIGLKLRKPKSKFRMNERVLRSERNLIDLKAADQFVCRNRPCTFSLGSVPAPELQQILLNWDPKLAECGLWDRDCLAKLVSKLELGKKLTVRSRFPHKKKKADLQRIMEKFKALRLKSRPLPPIKEAGKAAEAKDEPAPAEEVKKTPVPATPIPEPKLQSLKEESSSETQQDSEKDIWMWIVIEPAAAPQKEASRPFGHGLRLIFPAGVALQFMRRLTYAGARPIGLMEHNSIMHERGLFVFPDDFPLTRPYDEAKRLQGIQKAVEYYRRPPARRLNYQKVGFPYPFVSLWSDLVPQGMDVSKLAISPLVGKSLDGLVLAPVEIEMLRRYVPKDGAIICIALGEHKQNAAYGAETEPIHETQTDSWGFNRELERLTGKSSVQLYDKTGKAVPAAKVSKKKREAKRKEIRRLVAVPEEKKHIPGEKMKDTPAPAKKTEIPPPLTSAGNVLTPELKIVLKEQLRYRIVGFVTSGGYSMLEGRGHGIGYVVRYPGAEEGTCAFVRNPNSRLYYPCVLRYHNLPYSC